MASIETIANRKAVRVIISATKRRKMLRKGESVASRDHRMAIELCLKHYRQRPDPVRYDVRIDFRYWQARACEWDPSGQMVRRGSHKGELVDERETEFWRWWTSLHYQSRDQLVKLTRLRTLGGAPLRDNMRVQRKW